MPLRESEAIVLRGYPLGEADRLISFLSRSMGRMRGVAAGARRIKSRFGSTLEPMSYIRIWFYERDTRDLVRINQCELVESFVSVFQDYAAGNALTLLAEITEAVLPERESADSSFRLLLLCAQTIKKRRETDLPLNYFSLWTLRLGGWLGSLERCARCGRELAGGGGYATRTAPGVFCTACRSSGMSVISPQAMAAARRMLGERLDKIQSAEFAKPVWRELLRYLLDLVEQQIERKLVSRRMVETVA